MSRFFSAAIVWAAMISCGPGEAPVRTPSTTAGEEVAPAAVYADEVVSFEPGANAGFGQAKLPDVVLGPPRGKGPAAGSTDVVSLGAGGTIVVGFSARPIGDGPGPDFVVFENPFAVGGDPTNIFAELAEVSVSSDGQQWHVFSCDEAGDGNGRWPGCAGWSSVEDYDVTLDPLDPAVTGGDAFDLSAIGVTSARYVRVRDLSASGDAPTAGFDLDAVGAVHLQ